VFKVRCIDLDAGGKYIAILNNNDAEELGVRPLDRIVISYKNKRQVAIVNVSETFVKRGEVVVYSEVSKKLKLKGGEEVEIAPRKPLLSKSFIKRKIQGYTLSEEEIREIISDILHYNLNDLEISALITALAIRGMEIEEAVAFSKAFVSTGEKLRLNRKIILDKHSLGGVPGDKTSLLLVPIIASLGLTIPKTSSRAITSAAGTADRMEVLAPVTFGIEEMERIVKRTNACIVWGGAVNIAPVDNMIIKIEYPLEIDPLYIPSIISKKKAVGATHVVVDLPTGRGSKLPTFGSAYEMAHDLTEVAKRMKIKMVAAITYGEQPIGHAVGPALEAREALAALRTMKPQDLVDKACSLAGILLSMVNKGNKETALRALKTGKAERKLREIIAAQGGDERIRCEDIEVGDKSASILSEKSGLVMWIKNREIAEIAKIAGAPRDKGAGVIVHKKISERVRKGEKLLTIYSNNSLRLNRAYNFAEHVNPVVVVDNLKKAMLIKKIEAERHEKPFILER